MLKHTILFSICFCIPFFKSFRCFLSGLSKTVKNSVPIRPVSVSLQFLIGWCIQTNEGRVSCPTSDLLHIQNFQMFLLGLPETDKNLVAIQPVSPQFLIGSCIQENDGSVMSYLEFIIFPHPQAFKSFRSFQSCQMLIRIQL